MIEVQFSSVPAVKVGNRLTGKGEIAEGVFLFPRGRLLGRWQKMRRTVTWTVERYHSCE